MNPNKIGKFIYELRREKNLSQYQLADMIPISRQGVSKWERGKTIPDHQTLLRLSEIFDVSINELLTGERLPNNSIEALEETTLSILDQSTKKTKKIKRITTISISIITILLLAFLSYYFINSYNTTEVYTIYGQSKNFATADGLMIITKEKMYMKLGKLTNINNYEIENLKLYHKKKTNFLVEDSTTDNIVIKENIGYYDKIRMSNTKNIINDMYLEITYENNQKEIIKLNFVKDFSNNSLFFLKQHKESHKIEKEEEQPKATEENKEEVKPTIKETTETSKKENTNKTENKSKEDKVKQEEEKQEETKTEEPKQEEPKEEIPKQEEPKTNEPKEEQAKEDSKEEEPQSEEPQEIVITTDMVIDKIKEVCTNAGGAYTCNYDDNITIIYHSIMNKITLYKDNSVVGQYFVSANNYMCFVDDCETIFSETFKKYLFS